MEQNNQYWKDFSTLIGGTFNESAYWYSAKTIFNYKDFDIVFDNYRGVTRVYCRFTNHKKLNMRIDKMSFINKCINIFNKQVVKTNDRNFDKNYLVHSIDPSTGAILNTIVRKMYQELNIAGLFISTNKGIWEEEVLHNDQYELAIYINDSALEYTYLIEVKALFEHLIDNLTIKNKVVPVAFIET